jgi:hypothetical protein
MYTGLGVALGQTAIVSKLSIGPIEQTRTLARPSLIQIAPDAASEVIECDGFLLRCMSPCRPSTGRNILIFSDGTGQAIDRYQESRRSV